MSAVILCVCCAYLLNRLRAKPLIWIFFAASALALMLASSALLPAWAVYASLPFVFSLSVYAWLKTRQEGTDE